MRLPAFLWRGAGFLLPVLFACGQKPAPRTVTPAFFYWQTTFRLSTAEVRYLDSLGCRKLYVKYLDLGRDPDDGSIRPLARLEIADTSGLAGLEIVPCIFITNSVFQNLAPEKIAWLADRVVEAVGDIGFPFNPTPDPSPKWEGSSPRGKHAPLPFRGGVGGGVGDIQFDCDWTPSTRDNYFAFLRAIKTRLPAGCRLSATVRLHQYKFPRKTGVPPVDRGMLMLYNTGDIEDSEEGNSIFDPLDVRKYLVGAPREYDLPLDLALPVFSWALVYRQDELWKIIPGLDGEALADTVFFASVPPETAASAGTATFLVRQGTFRSGFYLRPGDRLRVETVPPDLLRAATDLARTAALAKDATVAFFHLDSSVVRHYPAPMMQMLWQEF